MPESSLLAAAPTVSCAPVIPVRLWAGAAPSVPVVLNRRNGGFGAPFVFPTVAALAKTMSPVDCTSQETLAMPRFWRSLTCANTLKAPAVGVFPATGWSDNDTVDAWHITAPMEKSAVAAIRLLRIILALSRL